MMLLLFVFETSFSWIMQNDLELVIEVKLAWKSPASTLSLQSTGVPSAQLNTQLMLLVI